MSTSTYKMLQERFANGADKYPGIRHVLVEWPVGGPEPPELPERYKPSPMAHRWADGPGHAVVAGWLNREHLQSDDIEARRRFEQYAAAAAGELLASNPLPGVSESTLAIADPVRRWLRTLHDVRQPQQHTWKRFSGSDATLTTPVQGTAVHRFAVIEDVFLTSAMLLSSAVEADTQVAEAGNEYPAWPPAGYVSTSTIRCDTRFTKRGKNPSITTITRWIEREHRKGHRINVSHAPDTHENSYPEDWILQQIQRWNPRKTTS